MTELLEYAGKLLNEALTEYEGNGTRYEPADREKLIDLINDVDKLRKRLEIFMANLPYMDHHPIDTQIETKSGPVLIGDIFQLLDQQKYISPKGPLIHSLAYRALRELFSNTRLSIDEAAELLHRERSN